MKNPEFNNRIENLRKKIIEPENISDILIFKEEDIFYLTGFFGKNSNSALLIAENKNYLFVNFIYIEDAKNSAKINNLEIILYTGDRNILIHEVLTNNNIKEILMQSGFISYNEYLKIETELKSTDIYSRDIEDPVGKLRLIKDEFEQQLIREACKLTDKTFDFICSIAYKEFLKLSESVLALEMEKFLISTGGDGKSFDFVVANNSNSSKPHHFSQNLMITEGLLLMDFGVVLKKYCSDITRTIFIGKNLDSKFREIYEIVKEAQQMSVAFCKAGITASELDNIARNYISKKGFGENFGHSLGHGVGIEIHEPPWINKKNDEILKEGMVLTIEPGIYVEGFGGVRIEDMVIVKKNGCENLYSSSKEIIQVY